jgi:hypothetical protein
MPNEALLTAISNLICEIRPTLEKAGLARSATVYKRSKLEEANDIELEKTRLWLIGFKAGYVDKYEEAHAVVPQGVWDI